MADSPLEQMVEQVRAALNAQRLKRLKPLEELELRLGTYRGALEQALAVEYAKAHDLRQPELRLTAQEAAEALLQAVCSLPELVGRCAPALGRVPSETGPLPAESSSPLPPPLPEASSSGRWPHLAEALRAKPLTIVGGVARRERLASLPPEVRALVEWVDTTRHGMHSIGNLEGRIRDHRLCGVILLDGIVSHQHSGPLVSAARRAKLPLVYGGRGGANALAEAFQKLEQQLSGALAPE